MQSLTLLTDPECHLCRHSRQVLDVLSREDILRWREISTESEEGRSLVAAGAPPMRPVLYGETGTVIAYGRLSERRLRKAFAL